MESRWEVTFAALSALLGEPPSVIAAVLGDGQAHAATLLAALESPSRAARARAIAGGVAEVCVTIEALRLA